MSGLVLDASLALQWFLEDETDRTYSLKVLESLRNTRASVPVLWFYEIGNRFIMAQRRKRIDSSQVREFLRKLLLLPIDAAEQTASEILQLPDLALTHRLTVYDAAYLALASAANLPLATNDHELRRAASAADIKLF